MQTAEQGCASLVPLESSLFPPMQSHDWRVCWPKADLCNTCAASLPRLASASSLGWRCWKPAWHEQLLISRSAGFWQHHARLLMKCHETGVSKSALLQGKRSRRMEEDDYDLDDDFIDDEDVDELENEDTLRDGFYVNEVRGACCSTCRRATS